MTGGPLEDRTAGVLLHPSSLPGPGACGSLGADARRFIDLMAAAGLRIWQVLPLGPTHEDGCPYQLISVHAGNPALIDLQWLVDQGWLTTGEAQSGWQTPEGRHLALDRACAVFQSLLADAPHAEVATHYRHFLQQSAYWLEDYVRFQAFRDDFGGQPWNEWPEALRRCEPVACELRAGQLSARLTALRFCQFVFHCQWHALREYANARGVALFGDMPIYVHLESADVWAHQAQFNLDDSGRPVTVTGVPPDYFSADGQLWGNPQYNWAAMEATGFEWWLQRFASAAQYFDIARIDHFRALDAYWDIPAGASSAREGKWIAAPGRALLSAVRERYPDLRLVAENLGSITPEVEALRHDFALPGMLILQFAFDGSPDNPYLPHKHASGDIVYTGTHDNNTTLGWFESLDQATQQRVYQYFNQPQEGMPWMLIREAMASAANTAIVPWQDFLGLDGAHRMNTPGTLQGNWQWRFTWEQVPPGIAARIRELLVTHDRLGTLLDEAVGDHPALPAASHM